ncbi:DUF523 domain-containing protein [Niallia sp. SS-2023]|uniref:DUF523 domain-containing protein n=1 Tax=Niallia sp. SS-2023 TaxID=3051155 RepID=UPI00254BE2E1|nr:DUF523 domain-containing protein [Niallia sp. SS-2023]MDL0435021.1 DUF523 domain-containing protein [Niallia sp. SS-2023]
MIVVSSCLAGLKVRYNGSHSLNVKIKELIDKKEAIAVCPELLGGFQTPREPCEIKGGNGYDVLDGHAIVIDKSGNDVTDLYVDGAFKTLAVVKQLQASTVVLKESSPSCGSSYIYNGNFEGIQHEGAGITTALLRRAGIKVISENELAKALL